MGVVIQAIRDSARGERCTMGISRICDPATVVFCHGPRLGFAGVGQKVDDWWGAYGCAKCHDTLDKHAMHRAPELMVWMRAIQETQRRLYEKGIMRFPEKPKPPRVVNKIVKHPGVIR